MTFRNGFYAGLIVAVAWGVYLFRLWQPQRQIELHNRHLLEQIEEHDWKAVGEFISESYQDRWGNDRKLLLERLPQVFRALGKTRIDSSAVAVRYAEGRGYWTAKITIAGTGEFADFIQSRVNSLEAPFEFEWQPGATWPWDWKLVAVRNPALEISDFAPRALGRARLCRAENAAARQSLALPGGYFPSAVRNSVFAPSTSFGEAWQRSRARSLSP